MEVLKAIPYAVIMTIGTITYVALAIVVMVAVIALVAVGSVICAVWCAGSFAYNKMRSCGGVK